VRVTVPTGNGGNTASVCDPTKGFRYTDGRGQWTDTNKNVRGADRSNTLANFGKIANLHGRRIVEFALKFEF